MNTVLDLKVITTPDGAPEIEGYRRHFLPAETLDQARGIALKHRSPVAYWLRRGRRVYFYEAIRKGEQA